MKTLTLQLVLTGPGYKFAGCNMIPCYDNRYDIVENKKYTLTCDVDAIDAGEWSMQWAQDAREAKDTAENIGQASGSKRQRDEEDEENNTDASWLSKKTAKTTKEFPVGVAFDWPLIGGSKVVSVSCTIEPGSDVDDEAVVPRFPAKLGDVMMAMENRTIVLTKRAAAQLALRL